MLAPFDVTHVTSTVNPWDPTFVKKMLSRTTPSYPTLQGPLPPVRVKGTVHLGYSDFSIERMIGELFLGYCSVSPDFQAKEHSLESTWPNVTVVRWR